MNPASKRRQNTHPPIPQLIPNSFNDNVLVVRHHHRSQLLIRQIPQHILRCQRIRIMLLRQPRNCHIPRHFAQLPPAHQSFAQIPRASPPHPHAKRHLPASPGAGDTSTLSCVISSIRQAEAPSRNVSPVLLSNTISPSSSPNAHRLRSLPARKPHTSHDQESSLHSESGIRFTPVRGVIHPRPVPGNPWPQIRKLVRGIPPCQHIQHSIERPWFNPANGPALLTSANKAA